MGVVVTAAQKWGRCQTHVCSCQAQSLDLFASSHVSPARGCIERFQFAACQARCLPPRGPNRFAFGRIVGSESTVSSSMCSESITSCCVESITGCCAESITGCCVECDEDALVNNVECDEDALVNNGVECDEDELAPASTSCDASVRCLQSHPLCEHQRHNKPAFARNPFEGTKGSGSSTKFTFLGNNTMMNVTGRAAMAGLPCNACNHKWGLDPNHLRNQTER